MMAEEKMSSVAGSLRAAQELLAKRKPEEVVKLCKTVLKQERNNYDACVLLGSALLQLQQYVPAEKALRFAVGVNASKLAAWQRLVDLYEATGKSQELAEACQEARIRAQTLEKMDRYFEYTRKLAQAHVSNNDHENASSIWQEIVNNTSVPDSVYSEAILGLADAKSSLLEKAIQEEFKRRVLQDEAASVSYSGQPKDGLNSHSCSPPKSTEEDVLGSVEDEFADCELSNELELLLRKVTSQSSISSEHNHEILLRLLLRKTRAYRESPGTKWRTAKLQTLQQCVTMIFSHRALMAFEVASKFLEDDDGEEIFEHVEMESNGRKQHGNPLFGWFGRDFVHTYPEHGLALAALALALHHGPTQGYRWQVLADVHVQQKSYSNAVECVRRGLQAVCKSRTLYGLGLKIVEMRLQLTLGEGHLASQNYSKAEAAFQYVAEGAITLAGRGRPLITATLQGLAKVSLAQGDSELFHARLSELLSVDAECHWAVAELGWLAFQDGNLSEAAQYLERAIGLEARDASYHRRLGLVYWKDNLKDKALSQFMDAVKLDPRQSDMFRYLGHYYKEDARDMQRAVRCYQKCIDLDPEDEEAGLALCDLLDRGGEEVLEMDICRRATERSRRAFWSSRQLGFLQVHRLEWTEAVQNLQHGLRGYVTDADLWEALGLAYQHLGKLTAALKAYERAITLGRQSPVFALLQSGTILLLLASYAKAIDMFREALERVPQHVGAICGLGEAMLGRARECLGTGAFSWSADLSKDAVDLLLGSATSCSNVGAFWKLLGDLQVTHAQALPCVVVDSVNVSAYEVEVKSLQAMQATIESWCQIRLSSLRNATRSYQRALHLCPSQGSLYSDLAVACDLISALELNREGPKSPWSPAVKAVCGGLRMDGNKPDLWVTLGMLSRSKALKQHSFIQALRIDRSHALAWGGLGQLYVGEGHEDLARDAFDRARSANPSLPLPWAGMAYVHGFIESEKDIQEAYASCSYAVQLSPTVEVQLGLGKLAARTLQLENAEVHTAVEQALQHAPNSSEAHNLRGLLCEGRGDIRASIRAFVLARHALALPSSTTSRTFSEESVAVSLNLARVLCKAGEARAAVEEYGGLAELGVLEMDAGALRGYAVALWESGWKDQAIVVAKNSVAVEGISGSTTGGWALVIKMIHCKSGPSYALKEIRSAAEESLSNARSFLSSLAAAVVCGDDCEVYRLMRGGHSLFGQQISIQAHLLVAAAKQIMPGKQDLGDALRQLQTALHLYPHSLSLRARFGALLLVSSGGDDANVVTRCCGVPLSNEQQHLHHGSISSTLAAAGYACALCGNIDSCNFSACQGGVQHSDALLRDLQRWVHNEPWNVPMRSHLVLTVFQKARAQNYPLSLCQALRRMAETALSVLSTEEGLTCPRNFRLLLLLIISESALRIGDNNEAIIAAKTATELQLPTDELAIAVLQLARCYATMQNLNFFQVELSRARRALSRDNVEGWMTVVELDKFSDWQSNSPSLENLRRAIIGKRNHEQNKWMGRLHLATVNGLMNGGDLWLAQEAAAEAAALLPENALFHLLHGALCLELVLTGSNTELLSSAVRSLSKAVVGSGERTLPLATILLCRAQTVKGSSKSGDFSKWDRKLWTEWLAWPSDCRPAELCFQMGMLAKKAQGTLLGIAGTTEVSWSAKAWLQRAVRLRPDSLLYWTSLQQQ